MRWIVGLNVSLHDIFAFERLGANWTLYVCMVRRHVFLKIRPAFKDGVAVPMATMVPVRVCLKNQERVRILELKSCCKECIYQSGFVDGVSALTALEMIFHSLLQDRDKAVSQCARPCAFLAVHVLQRRHRNPEIDTVELLTRHQRSVRSSIQMEKRCTT